MQCLIFDQLKKMYNYSILRKIWITHKLIYLSIFVILHYYHVYLIILHVLNLLYIRQNKNCFFLYFINYICTHFRAYFCVLIKASKSSQLGHKTINQNLQTFNKNFFLVLDFPGKSQHFPISYITPSVSTIAQYRLIFNALRSTSIPILVLNDA